MRGCWRCRFSVFLLQSVSDFRKLRDFASGPGIKL